MKRLISFNSLGVFIIQLAAWSLLILFAPLMIWLTGDNPREAYVLMLIMQRPVLPCMIVYFLNYYILIPKLLWKSTGGKVWYFIINFLILGLVGIYLINMFAHVYITYPDEARIGLTAGGIFIFVLNIGSVCLAIALRSYQRARSMKLQLNEEIRRRKDAELIWLKNQLNPHFLFNSLNNISSLIYLDSDKAQDCIGRLSDLLRYAIYESDKKSVPLSKEIDFLSNYIELMSLRCNDRTDISCEINFENGNLLIVPLVLVSLIENAFKHGVSASKESFIKFHLSEVDGTLSFLCENSNHAKSDSNRSGKGIGLANTRKRLDLIYGDRYSWSQFSDATVFRVEIIIQLLTEK